MVVGLGPFPLFGGVEMQTLADQSSTVVTTDPAQRFSGKTFNVDLADSLMQPVGAIVRCGPECIGIPIHLGVPASGQ